MPILAAPRSKHRDDAVQTLAVAVVLQAARDLTDPSEQLRAQARRDIADGGLDYWLSLLDLDADGVKRRLLQLKAGAGMLLGRWMLPRSSYTPRKTPVRKRKAATLPAAGVEDASELRAGVQI